MILRYLKRKPIQHMVIQNENVKILVGGVVEKLRVFKFLSLTNSAFSILFCNYSSPNYPTKWPLEHHGGHVTLDDFQWTLSKYSLYRFNKLFSKIVMMT